MFWGNKSEKATKYDSELERLKELKEMRDFYISCIKNTPKHILEQDQRCGKDQHVGVGWKDLQLTIVGLDYSKEDLRKVGAWSMSYHCPHCGENCKVPLDEKLEPLIIPAVPLWFKDQEILPIYTLQNQFKSRYTLGFSLFDIELKISKIESKMLLRAHDSGESRDHLLRAADGSPQMDPDQLLRADLS